MRGARGSEVALPATRITERGKAGSGSKGSAKKKQPEGLSLRLSVGNRQFREAAPSGKAARNSPSAYLTGAFTGGGKGSA